MIKSFQCKHTEQLFNEITVRRFSGIERQARKRLRILNDAKILGDLKGLPGNCFEALKGDRKGQYSIRINKQWRICFKWDDAPYDVGITDYH
jgi:proteic killer suppression protein